MLKNIYITTAIDYVNAEPHLGHALEKVQADVLARYWRAQGRQVFFLTGTDEHGTKNFESAKKFNMDPQDFVDKNAAKFKELVKLYNISNDDFIRTTDQKKHWPAVVKMWRRLMQNGDLFKDTYEGLYCVGCEEFKLPKDLVDDKCPDHNRVPELLHEENYFFNLGKYTKQIIEKITSGELEIIPQSREHEILNILQAGFDRVSFSRPRTKLNWGVPVPDDDEQVMYVWCDALTNYISALEYAEESEKFNKFWQHGEITHIIGKGILRFHAAIWPAMLLAAGLKLPNRLFVHGYITIEGKKMSKSLGNVVDPMALVQKYGADPVRYYLLKEIPSMGDGDFSDKRFKEIYNSDLTNGLGNLISRTTNMIASYLQGQVDWSVTTDFNWLRISEFTENLQYDKALTEVKKIIDQLNKMIDDAKPWQLIKSGSDEDIEKIKNILSVLAVAIKELSIHLKPYLPQTATKIEEILKTDKIVKAEPLFPRLTN